MSGGRRPSSGPGHSESSGHRVLAVPPVTRRAGHGAGPPEPPKPASQAGRQRAPRRRPLAARAILRWAGHGIHVTNYGSGMHSYRERLSVPPLWWVAGMLMML